MFGFSKTETENQETAKQGVWGSQLSDAVADIRKSNVTGKKGTKRNASGSDDTATRGDLPRGTEEAARKLFDPEAWRAIVRAPFNLGKAITGRECWELEKRQEDTLATSTSATAEYFLQTDPKWVCLTLFCFNWSVVLTEKFAANKRERMKEEAANPKPKTPEEKPHEPVPRLAITPK